MGGGAPGLPLTLAGPNARVGVASAGFFDDEEMNAAGPATRNVLSEVAGLTVYLCQSHYVCSACCLSLDIPRSANAVACRVVENIFVSGECSADRLA
jgi:hypothetical protein